MNKLWIPIVALVIPAGIAGATLIDPEEQQPEVLAVQAEPPATHTPTPPPPTVTPSPVPTTRPPEIVLSPMHDNPELTIAWQNSLSALGYPIIIDGIFGPSTTATTAQFQIDNNLDATGVVDEQMLRIVSDLNTPESTPALRPTPTPVPPTPTATPVRVTATPVPPPQPMCDPNYGGACVPIASDVDCQGGRGNGPAYVVGPVTVIGVDIYGLDGNDNDGIGCE